MYICYSISKSVTQKEWDKVYKETLVLADKLNLADWDKFYYKGVRAYAYCKVKEKTDEDHGKKRHFWLACGEYNHMTEGEYFRLEREIDDYNEKAGPAILWEIESNGPANSRQFDDQIDTYARKTWGGAYFIRLLAILCFIESKLKEKFYIYGDIDKHNCESAVKLVNKYLKKPIVLPARCDCNRLYEIVKTIEISDEKKIFLMEKAYLGEIDVKYKRFIEEKFDKKIINQYWTNRFKDCTVDDYKFEEKLKAYLSYGFDFKDLFSYISFKNPKEEYLKFLELIFKIENNKDSFSMFLGITRDPKDNNVRGFSWEFRCSLFGHEALDLSKPYTFDDYENELSKYFGEHIDVKSFLKEKIKDEDEDSFIPRLKKYCNKDNYYIFKGEDKYDIIFSINLMYYKTGDKIAPYLMKEIKAAVKSNKKRLADKKFKELETKETTEQIYELIDLRHQFPVRDIDWYHAIDYFNSHTDALQRYYPIFHMKLEFLSANEDIAKALFINDDFYEFCKGL